MERIDKLKFTEETLMEIKHIHKKGFAKSAHPAIWRDLAEIMTRVDMLYKVLKS